MIISIDFDYILGYKNVKVTNGDTVAATFASDEPHVDFFKALIYAIHRDNIVMLSSSCDEFVELASQGYFGDTTYVWIVSDMGELFIPEPQEEE